MLFQIYGERAGFQLLGWLMVFLGLIAANELARRSKKGGIFFFLILPAGLTIYFIAVAVGAANFVNPYATREIVEGIEAFMEKEGIGDIHEIIGCVK